MKSVTINGVLFKETYLQDLYTSIDGKVLRYYNGSYRLLKPDIDKKGYKRIQYKRKNHLIHRLVYSAWSENGIPEGFVVDHIDNNPSNNAYENLQAITQSQNIKRAFDLGRKSKTNFSRIKVLDKVTGITTWYETVKDFLRAIGAPEYIVNNGGLGCLEKRKSLKHRYVILEQQRYRTSNDYRKDRSCPKHTADN